MEWRASHILVQDRTLAQELLKKAKSGANFGNLAADYSTCPSKSRGGDLGWFGPGKMVPPFEEAVMRMGVGSISGIVTTRFGLHIIKLTGKR